MVQKCTCSRELTHVDSIRNVQDLRWHPRYSKKSVKKTSSVAVRALDPALTGSSFFVRGAWFLYRGAWFFYRGDRDSSGSRAEASGFSVRGDWFFIEAPDWYLTDFLLYVRAKARGFFVRGAWFLYRGAWFFIEAPGFFIEATVI